MQVGSFHPIGKQINPFAVALLRYLRRIVGLRVCHQGGRRRIEPLDQQAAFLIDIEAEWPGDFARAFRPQPLLRHRE